MAISILLWSVIVGPLSSEWWFRYTMFTGVWMTLGIGVIVAVWFTIGVSVDLLDLFRTLKTVKRVDSDDGTVRDHHNADEVNGNRPPPPGPAR